MQWGRPGEGDLSALVQRGLGVSFLGPGVNTNCPQHWEWPHEGETGLSHPSGAAPPPSRPQAWWQSPRPGDKVWEGGRASPQPLRLFPQGESQWFHLLPLSHLSSPTPMHGGGWQTGGWGFHWACSAHCPPSLPPCLQGLCCAGWGLPLGSLGPAVGLTLGVGWETQLAFTLRCVLWPARQEERADLHGGLVGSRLCTQIWK